MFCALLAGLKAHCFLFLSGTSPSYRECCVLRVLGTFLLPQPVTLLYFSFVSFSKIHSTHYKVSRDTFSPPFPTALQLLIFNKVHCVSCVSLPTLHHYLLVSYVSFPKRIRTHSDKFSTGTIYPTFPISLQQSTQSTIYTDHCVSFVSLRTLHHRLLVSSVPFPRSLRNHYKVSTDTVPAPFSVPFLQLTLVSLRYYPSCCIRCYVASLLPLQHSMVQR